MKKDISTCRIHKSWWTRNALLTAGMAAVTVSPLAVAEAAPPTSSQPVKKSLRIKKPSPKTQRQLLWLNDLRRRQTEARIARIEKLLRRRPEGTLALKPQTRGASLSVVDRKFAEVALKSINTDIKGGKVRVDQKLNVSSTERTRGNYRGFRRHWWGYEIWMSSNDARRIANAYYGTAAGTTLYAATVAVIPGIGTMGAAIPAAMASWFGMYGWWIHHQASKGRGVYMRVTYNANIYWVSAQE